MSLPDFVGGVQTLPESLVLAVDTEFIDTHTLTVQVAARLAPDTLAVQVYRSQAIPDPPAGFDVQQYLPITAEKYGRFCQRIIVRPVQPLTPHLSPMRMVRDLLDLPKFRCYSRFDGEQISQLFSLTPGFPFPPAPANVPWDPRRKRWAVPTLNLTLVGHYLRADFGRLFGWRFLDSVKKLHLHGRPRIDIEGRKLLRFLERRGTYRDSRPVLEYAYQGPNFYKVQVEMRDTMLPFGPASLDSLCKTFLGITKSNVLSVQDKEDMLGTFSTRTADAYGYAMADAVNTLLVHEQMIAKDREIYQSFGFAEENMPPLQAFQGGRVSTFLLATTRKDVAADSIQLASQQSLRSLMRKGGAALFQDHPDVSKFGEQTGKVHGGLLFNRSPTKLWHEAEGMLADVDMSGCYVENASRIGVYWGRPVVLEPGARRTTVAQAVAMVRELAPEDGWVLFASGPIRGFANVLIPSTEDATTSISYGDKQRHKRRVSARQAFRLEIESDPGAVRGTQGTKIYTAQVDFGVVTSPVWLMIHALPPEARRQYEQLVVDSLLFYPKALIAENGVHYDELVRKYESDSLPWEAEFNAVQMELVQRQRIGADYVSLHFPLGEYARKVAGFRKAAQSSAGKDSGLDLAWKQHGNTLYGTLASPFHPVNNSVAANLITSMARARAFSLSQALNSIQLITDGCTYRRDQVPAISYAECLQAKANYPSHRAEDDGAIPFRDPATIPIDKTAFTAWYVEHAKQFFRVEGAEYESFFSSHQLEHKLTEKSKSATFDALGCDGAGNYIKAARAEGGGCQVEAFKARSYGRTSKETLQGWLMDVYRTDNLTELPPLAEDQELLSLPRACREARAALEAGAEQVYLPLGLHKTKVMNYHIIKASAFLFQTHRQRRAILKRIQDFEEEFGCGLEVLAFRRTYGERRKGSVVAVLNAIDAVIQAGESNLVTALNLKKVTDLVETVAPKRKEELEKRKAHARQDLWERIDASRLAREADPTAWLVTQDDLLKVREDGTLLPMQAAPSIVHSPAGMMPVR